MFKFLSVLVAILAIGSGLLVGALNADSVELDLLWVTLNWPLGLVLVMALCVGFLFGLVMTWLLQVVPVRVALRRERAAASLQPQKSVANGMIDD